MTSPIFPRGEHPYPEPEAACACGHSVDAHWEVAEPGTFSEDGSARVGCSHLGCRCQFVSAPA